MCNRNSSLYLRAFVMLRAAGRLAHSVPWRRLAHSAPGRNVKLEMAPGPPSWQYPLSLARQALEHSLGGCDGGGGSDGGEGARGGGEDGGEGEMPTTEIESKIQCSLTALNSDALNRICKFALLSYAAPSADPETMTWSG